MIVLNLYCGYTTLLKTQVKISMKNILKTPFTARVKLMKNNKLPVSKSHDMIIPNKGILCSTSGTILRAGLLYAVR